MGLDLGKFLTNAGSLGTTYFRDQRRAKRDQQGATDLIAENTARAQQLFDEDLGTSALANLAADPALVAKQNETLSRYGELSRDGWTNTDRDALEAQNFQTRQEEQSQRGAVMDAAARRGDTSGGNALMASLAAQQGGANRASQRGTSLAVEGRQRALDALANQGNLAGQMRGQQVSEDTARGGAMDQFRQWAAGERSNRASALSNASLGQAQDITNRANELRSSDTVGMLAEGYLNYQTAGLSGAAGGLENNVGTPGTSNAKGMPGTATTTPGSTVATTGPQQKGRAMAGSPAATSPQTTALGQLAGGAYGLGNNQQRRPRRAGV